MECCVKNSITVVYEGVEKFLEVEYYPTYPYPTYPYQPGTWSLQFCTKCKQHWWLDTTWNQDTIKGGFNHFNEFVWCEKYLTDKDRQEISNRIGT